MKLKINVKEEHIVNGKCLDERGCAIALAVRDIIPEALINYGYIQIDSQNVIVNNDRMLEDTQDKMCIFDGFDRNHIVGKARLEHLKPFSFEVDINESLLFPNKLLEEIEEIIKGSKNIELVIADAMLAERSKSNE